MSHAGVESRHTAEQSFLLRDAQCARAQTPVMQVHSSRVGNLRVASRNLRVATPKSRACILEGSRAFRTHPVGNCARDARDLRKMQTMSRTTESGCVDLEGHGTQGAVRATLGAHSGNPRDRDRGTLRPRAHEPSGRWCAGHTAPCRAGTARHRYQAMWHRTRTVRSGEVPLPHSHVRAFGARTLRTATGAV